MQIRKTFQQTHKYEASNVMILMLPVTQSFCFWVWKTTLTMLDDFGARDGHLGFENGRALDSKWGLSDIARLNFF